MSTSSLGPLIDRLDELLSAMRGIARALDPDPDFSTQDRSNLSVLCMLVIEQQERCLQALLHLYQAPPAQEGDVHGP